MFISFVHTGSNKGKCSSVSLKQVRTAESYVQLSLSCVVLILGQTLFRFCLTRIHFQLGLLPIIHSVPIHHFARDFAHRFLKISVPELDFEDELCII